MDPGAGLLSGLLRDVSRSFYLTLRILPAPVRPQIGLAYLLARISDTIADTDLIPIPNRLAALHEFGDALRGRGGLPDFTPLLSKQTDTAEKVILERAGEALDLLHSFLPEDQALIRAVLATIISGQVLDLERFGAGEVLRALRTEAELDDYTYRVAGCVGEFWTKICAAHLYPSTDLTPLLPCSVRFGQGLQLINILRDIPRDLRLGRCYLPEEALAPAGLTPAKLRDPSMHAVFQPIYQRYLDKAQAHLVAGWEYTLRLPSRPRRVRLACAWPLLIGARTLKKLRISSPLQAQGPVKISRAEVRQILSRSVLLLPFPKRWAGLFPAELH
jgi:farnesyl-diphosphate farnesyltransferase